LIPEGLTYEDIAQMIEHEVLRLENSEEDVRAGCEIATKYRVATVCVRPSDVDQAVGWMEGSGVAVSSVVSGWSTTSAKLYETRDLLRRGAREIESALNLGKFVSRQFQYVEMELQQMAQACHEAGAILTVAFASLADDLMTIACRIAKRAEVDYARAGSLDDIRLMHRLCGERVKIKAGSVDTLSDALAVREAGCVRIATTATAAILEALKKELAPEPTQT
jgi:deoxyribose-phosphate aldolase